MNFKKGFTIVEIVVSLGILSIILLVIISFILWANYYGAKTRADSEVLENARRVLDVITYEIRGAKSIYNPTTTSDQLSLETARYLPADEVSTFIDFFLCGAAVCFKKESQSPVVLNSDNVEISSISFNQLSGSNPSIKVNLT